MVKAKFQTVSKSIVVYCYQRFAEKMKYFRYILLDMLAEFLVRIK